MGFYILAPIITDHMISVLLLVRKVFIGTIVQVLHGLLLSKPDITLFRRR